MTGEAPPLPGARVMRPVTAVLTLAVLLLAVLQLTGLRPFGFLLIDTKYLVLVGGIPLGLTFLYLPRGRPPGRAAVAVRTLLALISWCLTALIFFSLDASLANGYEFGAPTHLAVACIAFWALVLEASRRAGGIGVAIIVLVASAYPILSDLLLGAQGMGFDLLQAASYFVFSQEGIYGIPLRTYAYVIVGYLLFGVALQRSGAAQFFMDISFSLFGQYRGGAAKVSVVSSAFLGSMSGSVVTNVLTTGALTIPAMRKAGLPPRVAGGVEACASTGSVLMPPIMGATAFVMASFLSVPYSTVVVAAILPSLLYFGGLFLQIDAFAARNQIKGLPRADLPRARDVLRRGWHYLLVLAVLIFLIATLENQGMAPFYATALLLVWDQIVERRFMRLGEWLRFFEDVGKLLAEIVGVLAGIGIVVGALSMTGSAAAITSEIAYHAGDSLLLLLILAAVAAFILGFGLPATAAYIFLAIVLAPAMVKLGVEPIAAHMFLFYWGMVSFITPPVAIGAFAAASMAQAPPMRTAFEAMRFGTIIYFIPFFFVLNPVLLGKGDIGALAFAIATATVGLWLIVGGLQGHVIGIGRVQAAGRGGGVAGMALRIALVAIGLVFIAPGGGAFGVSALQLTLIGLIAAALLGGVVYLAGRTRPGPSTTVRTADPGE